MINQNVTAWRSAPSAATVERLVLRWLDALVGFDGGGHGLLLGGGSAANLHAVGAAVTQALRQPGKTRGQLVLYTSSETHRSEEHTSELQSLMRISYAVFCLK